MEKQLPKVQELFAEAFIELQKEIGEESARAFKSASTADDPLALLMDPTGASSSTISRSSFRKQKSRNNSSSSNNRKKPQTKSNANDELEGGFIRETKLPERLRKLQNPQTFESRYGVGSPSSMPRKRHATISNNATKSSSTNPYDRKKQKPSTNIWNQVLDNPSSKKKATKKKMKFDDIEREMINNITAGSNASLITCSCGSTNVNIDGNVTRNNDMMKGEVWGAKSRSEDVVERCHCLACGRTWNEE